MTIQGPLPADQEFTVDPAGGDLWFRITVHNQQKSTCAVYYAASGSSDGDLVPPNIRGSGAKKIPGQIPQIAGGAMVGWDVTCALTNNGAGFRFVVAFYQGPNKNELTLVGDEIEYTSDADPDGFHVWDKTKFS